jgi:hypothetical protein
LDTQANQDPLVNLQLTCGSSFLKIKMGTQIPGLTLKISVEPLLVPKLWVQKSNPIPVWFKLYMKV